MNRQTIHQIIDHIFKNLMPAHGMAERPEQLALSHRMLDALMDGNIALCDAGTGIGKTYAYLTAGVVFQLWRDREGRLPRPILISTSSIALQNAVLNEYIPFLSELLMADGIIEKPIRAVIRKGKQHYVCDERLERRLRQVDMKKKNKAAANALVSLRLSMDIDPAEHLSGYDKERVCVPQVCDCRRSDCRYLAFLRDCKITQYAFQICNHNLLLADAMRREANHRPILPDSCAVVIDEAHKLPEASRQMFGETLEAADIRELAQALKREKYFLAADSLIDLSKPLLQTLEQPRENKPFSAYARLLAAPERVLNVIGKQLNDQLPPAARRQFREVSRAASLLCEDESDMIRYAARDDDGNTMLCATIPNLSGRLNGALWRQPQPLLLTSGTLAVGDDFHRFREEAGLAGNFRVRESVSLSPFDYEKNCLLYLPKAPLRIRENDYYGKLSSSVAELLRASHGHALVLFTSYAAMSAVKERLVRKNLPWPIITMNRSAVYTVGQFKRRPGAVLLATGAAWEGFDFPGDAVSMLIIPRLPFPQPDAIRERERKNYPTLREYIRAVVVPEMQIKLKQGFGRAIRTESDTCAVAILDERACAGGRYHDDVLAALPEMRRTSNIQEIRQFIHSVKDADYFKENGDDSGKKRIAV